MKMYGFFRSSTSHRLRIALNLKGLADTQIAVDLRHDAHRGAAYAAVNPQRLVPALDIDGVVLTQSPAILEWLEERHPKPPLLPTGAEARGHVRALAALVGCDIHPLNNRRVLEALRAGFGADETAIERWCGRWIADGFDAFEALLARRGSGGRYACGDRPTLADVYLVPQIESARRFEVDLARWPRLLAIDAACAELPAFAAAQPARQPDAG